MAKPTRRDFSDRLLALLPGAAALLAGACSSLPKEPEATTASAGFGSDAAPESPLWAQTSEQERSVGRYMAGLDATIRAWMDKTWTAASREDRQKQDRLELHLETEVRRGQNELRLQLESGPLKNRIIAATALGFTRDPTFLSPLLAALEDPSPEVEQNALIGLSLLASPDTPLEPIVERMRSRADPGLRASAAYCARRLLEAGARGGGVGDAARGGLVDADPIVRSQSALILALLLDGETADSLALLLSDETELVAAAAARALAYLGTEVPESKGQAARALCAALEDSRKLRRLMLVRNLIALSGRNYGNDVEAWSDWSRRLP